MDEMENNKLKSFWEKPEGLTGKIILGIGIVAGAIGLYRALPFLITLASNTLYLMGMLGIIAGVLYLIMDPKFRLLVSYAYKNVMRTITKLIIVTGKQIGRAHV